MVTVQKTRNFNLYSEIFCVYWHLESAVEIQKMYHMLQITCDTLEKCDVGA